MSINRTLGGTKAKAFGVLFESMFLHTCRANRVAITRFPDGCKSLGTNRLIRVKTPFDWILTYRGRTALIDTKTTDSDCFNHSKIVEHQVRDMALHEEAGAIAGYVIWLRKSDQVIFVNSLKLLELSLLKGSIGTDASIAILGDGTKFDSRLLFL